MAKINKHLITIFVPVIVIVVVAVIVGSVVVAASSRAPTHNVPPQYAASGVEPHAGDASVQVSAQASETNAPDHPVGVPEMETPSCEFSGLIGRRLKDIDVSAYAPRAIRVLHPGSMATMDYSPARINIHVDDKEIISQVTCG
jgi:Peptidase inhibitor I78 family